MNPGSMRVAAVALMLIPALASAQITTVISAPKRQQVAAQAAAQREAATQDSIARVTLTGMKEWVDSAANALALRPDTGVAAPDTTRVAAQPPVQRAESVAPRTSKPSEVFKDGARAPNTATPWPMIAVAGLGMMAVGALMRRRATVARAKGR